MKQCLILCSSTWSSTPTVRPVRRPVRRPHYIVWLIWSHNKCFNSRVLLDVFIIDIAAVVVFNRSMVIHHSCACTLPPRDHLYVSTDLVSFNGWGRVSLWTVLAPRGVAVSYIVCHLHGDLLALCFRSSFIVVVSRWQVLECRASGSFAFSSLITSGVSYVDAVINIVAVSECCSSWTLLIEVSMLLLWTCRWKTLELW